MPQIDRLNLYDRTVPAATRDLYKAVLTLTEPQARSLQARGLIELKGRRAITHAVLANGASIAAIKSVLREHVRAVLPIAEDNRTVRRAAGNGTTFEPHHTEAWADGRKTPVQITRELQERLRRLGMMPAACSAWMA